jgi:hypothetical protein
MRILSWRLFWLGFVIGIISCYAADAPNVSADRASPDVMLGRLIEVSKASAPRALAIDPQGKAHLLVAGEVQRTFSTCYVGAVSHVVIGANGVEQEETLYEKPPCEPPAWRQGWYAYDLAFDAAGRLHAVVVDRNFVWERGRWQEDPGEPCERYAHGGRDLACVFTVGAKDIGVSTTGRQVGYSLLGAFLTLGKVPLRGDFWNKNTPRRIAIASLGSSGWEQIFVYAADDLKSGDMWARDAVIFADGDNRLTLLHKRQFITDLASAATGDGILKRPSSDGKDIELPIRKLPVGKEIAGLRTRGSGDPLFGQHFMTDPRSDGVIVVTQRQDWRERPDKSGRRIVSLLESQRGSAGQFSEAQEILLINPSNDSLLGIPMAAPAPDGGFQLAVIVATEASNTCEYEARYYVSVRDRWSAPLALGPKVQRAGYCWRLGPYQALPPTSVQVAFDGRWRSFVAWNGSNGVTGRWIEFSSPEPK